MLPDRVSNPGPMAYESGALSIADSSKLIHDFSAIFLITGGHDLPTWGPLCME